MKVVKKTSIPGLELTARDDVRDIYALGHDKQLEIYTDRMALSGHPLEQPIPFRGVVCSQIALHWKNKFLHLIGHNLAAQDVEHFPKELQSYAPILKGRSVITHKLKPIPVTFRVVGYLTSDDWASYQRTGTVGGVTMRKGLREASKLENPVMIPLATGELADRGIDDLDKWVQRMYGPARYKTIEEACYSIYGVARGYTARRGVLLADTHFEFGLHNGKPYLTNDIMSPDISTYWPAEGYTPAQPQPSLDRQPLLHWLAQAGWVDSEPLPDIPQEIIAETSRRYRGIYEVMKGIEGVTQHEQAT